MDKVLSNLKSEVRREASNDAPKSFRTICADFSRSSTMHGVKYLGDRELYRSEKIFWIFSFLISVIGCSWMMLTYLDKYLYSAVTVTLDESLTPVWDIPFPAVTICPETKTLKKHVHFSYAYFNFDSKNLTNDQLRNLEAVVQVCDSHLFMGKKIQSGLNSSEIVSTLMEIAMPFNETLMFCLWRNQIKICSDLFSQTITEDGVCFTSNDLDITEIFKEEA